MRALKMISAVALVMAVTGTAWAVTVPGLPGGVDYLKSRNEDQGATYIVAGLANGDEFSFNPTGLVPGVPTAVAGTLNGGAGVKTVTKIGAVGAVAGEDSWGVALLYQIAPGLIANPGANGTQIGFVGPIVYDNSAGTQGTWLPVMFHSGVDVAVDVVQGSGTGGGGNGIPVGQQKETIKTTGLKFELYAADSVAMDPLKDSVNLVDYVSARRTAVDKYTGWAGAVPGEVLLATGTSNFFQSTVVVDAAGQIVSNSLDASTVYFDVTGGPWGAAWNSNALKTPDGVATDLWFQWTLDVGQRNWTVHSNDIGGALAVVPEPVTIMGVVLGLGGLGGYIRRRFQAA